MSLAAGSHDLHPPTNLIPTHRLPNVLTSTNATPNTSLELLRQNETLQSSSSETQENRSNSGTALGQPIAGALLAVCALVGIVALSGDWFGTRNNLTGSLFGLGLVVLVVLSGLLLLNDPISKSISHANRTAEQHLTSGNAQSRSHL